MVTNIVNGHLVEVKEVHLYQKYPNIDIWTECNESTLHLSTRVKYKLIFECSPIKFYVWEEDLHTCKNVHEVYTLLWNAYVDARDVNELKEFVYSIYRKDDILIGK
jgi:hypothetical protein